MKYLFIAEKPSLMRDVQSCYRKHRDEIIPRVGEIDFVALSGHVCTNYEPSDYDDWNVKWKDITYPMIPNVWKIKVIDDSYKKKNVRNIKECVHQYDGIIVGTDSDVEGYGIYYLLEHYLHLEKMPTLRFMEHSLTDSEILKSLLSMTDYHKDAAHVRFTESFLLRSRADWLYGMNATCMMTLKMNQLMTVGRVKAPTIKLVYDNSMAIENFKPEKYYQLEADYGSFSSVLAANGQPAKFKKLSEIPKLPLKGVVTQKVAKQTSTHAPKLFDLTSIQAEAGQMYGYSPQQTLDLVQSLYETHKVISYPRTQCRYVSDEKAKEFPQMLQKMNVFEDLAPFVKQITSSDVQRVLRDKQVVNTKEVEKESHDALLPTSKTPDLSAMTEPERIICNMIYRRLLAQFLPALLEDKVNLVIQHGDQNFVASGKTVVEQGWRKLYKDVKDKAIPDLQEGQEIVAEKINPVGKVTTPPKRLTQATLIAAMQNIANQIEDKELKKSLADSQGIGTPATRASIINEILKRGYVQENKKALYITESGKNYVESLKGIDILSPVFAAQMDTKIKQIQRGEESYDAVYKQIVSDLRNVCGQIDHLESRLPKTAYRCKRCGENLVNGNYNYECPSCDFKIPKQVCGKTITEAMLDSMYAGKMTPRYTFKKKDGKNFSGRLKLTEKGLEFDFSSGLSCPFCGKDVRVNRGGVFCDCGLKVFNPVAGKKLSDKELRTLFDAGRLNKSSGFVNKSGKEFSAALVLDKTEKTVKFEF